MPLLTAGRSRRAPARRALTDADAALSRLRELSPQDARMALAVGRLAIGAGGWVAPNALAKLYGVDGGREPSVAFVSRLFAARDVLMGAGVLEADGEDLDRWLRWGIAVDLSDAAAALLSGARRRLPWRAALMAASAACVGAYLGVVARRG